MENSSGFQDDLKKAVSTILMENESFIDKSKEKRKVVMEQTKEARTSMTECIISAKVRVDNIHYYMRYKLKAPIVL